MRKILIFIIITLFAFSFSIEQSYAKRFGGGRSFGVQRSMNNFSRMKSPLSNAAPRSFASRWLAPLAGLAAGGLIASLLMGNGLGTGLLTWLIIGSIIYLLINFLRRRQTHSAPPSPIYNREMNSTDSHSNSNFPKDLFSKLAYNSAANNYSPDFNAEEFLRDAKVQFIRLQAAYDQKNLPDLKTFTSPQVYGEIQMQLHERGDEPNQTEVVFLDASLAQRDQGEQNEASVVFSGQIRENGVLETFKEIWHFQKSIGTQNWIVAGIQQATE